MSAQVLRSFVGLTSASETAEHEGCIAPETRSGASLARTALITQHVTFGMQKVRGMRDHHFTHVGADN
jgi:hypothetical protein